MEIVLNYALPIDMYPQKLTSAEDELAEISGFVVDIGSIFQSSFSLSRSSYELNGESCPTPKASFLSLRGSGSERIATCTTVVAGDLLAHRVCGFSVDFSSPTGFSLFWHVNKVGVSIMNFSRFHKLGFHCESEPIALVNAPRSPIVQ
jgi:hypothetical protein